MRIALFAIVLPALAASVAGLKWTAPSTWKLESGARLMRAATYTLPLSIGDAGAAECVVYFFGAGQGGSVQANLDRWKKQVQSPTEAKILKRTVHALPVTTIDSTGDYAGMDAKGVGRNYRLLGAIVEGPGGNIFIKCTGPAKTIGANQPQFEQLLTSFDKEK